MRRFLTVTRSGGQHSDTLCFGLTSAEEPGCFRDWVHHSSGALREEGRGGREMYTESGRHAEREREREEEGGMVPSFIHWQASKNILSRFVCGGNRECFNSS